MNLDFQIKALLMSFVSTIILSMIAIPILKKLKVGQIQRQEGPESHIKKEGTPTMGGVVILVAILVAAIFMFVYYYVADITVAKNMIPLILATFGFGLIGFIDDFRKLILKNPIGLKPKHKMLGLLGVSVAFVMYLIYGMNIETVTYIPFVKTYITLPIWVYIPFAIFVMLAATNAVNLTDGIDGLASTVTAIIVTFFTVIALVIDVKEIAVFGSIITGSCLGFLIFNLNPAKVFMGDTGSLAFRWGYFGYCNLYKNAAYNSYCSGSLCYRNNICNDAGNVF